MSEDSTEAPSKPKRVIFVSPDYPPNEGGVATSTQRLARNLSLLGCSVVVFTLDRELPLDSVDYVKEDFDGAVRVFRIGPFSKIAGVDENNLAVARRRIFDTMERLGKLFCPQIILSFHAASSSGLMALYLARALEVPLIVGVRGNDVGRNIFSLKWLPALQMIVAGSSRIVCVSEHLKRRLLLAFPGVRRNACVIMNAVELPHCPTFQRGREYLATHTGWSLEDPVAVFIGTLREKKGRGILLSAVKEARTRVGLRLLVVGPTVCGGGGETCASLWNELIYEGALHVTGQVDRAHALKIAAEGDLVVMASVDDGLPNGLLEGMALGLCPIVSDLFSDIISKDCGWIVERNNSQAFAKALVEAGTAVVKRRVFAKAARLLVLERHDPKIEANAYVRIFDDVLMSDVSSL